MKIYRPFSILETLLIAISATVLAGAVLVFAILVYWHVVKNDAVGQETTDNDGFQREVSLAQVMGSIPKPEVKQQKKIEKNPPPKKVEKKVEPKKVEKPKKKIEKTPSKKTEPNKPALEKIVKPEPKPEPKPNPVPTPKPKPQQPVAETTEQPTPPEISRDTPTETPTATTAQNAQPAQQAVKAGNADKNSKQVLDEGALRGFHIDYGKKLALWLKRHTKYPDEIKYTGETYRVTIKFSVDTKGNLKDIAIVKTSNNQALDKAILQSGRMASPFPAPPVELHQTELTYEIPVSFITD